MFILDFCLKWVLIFYIMLMYFILDKILVYFGYMICVGGGWLVFLFVGFVYGLIYRDY